MVKRQLKTIRYTIFRTKWGYSGICGTECGLLRTTLAGPAPEKVKALLLKNLPDAEYEKRFFRTAQEQITAYFDGTYINFSKDIPIRLDGFSPFASRVLNACRDISFGQTVTYSRLAEKASGAARAVGNVLAKNPLPLIIPCHRVICANGKIGGFSAPGGIKLKTKLLKHEGVFSSRQRRGRDSNPRYPYGHTGFRNRLHRPLGHLSINSFESLVLSFWLQQDCKKIGKKRKHNT